MRDQPFPSGLEHTVDASGCAEAALRSKATLQRLVTRIVSELEEFPWYREPGGVSKAMLEEFGGDVAAIRQKKASAGGAIAGAPVYHEILEAAQGARAHATRAEVVADLRAAILEGKGSALSDAAAIVARGRIAQEATAPLRGQTLRHTVRLPQGAGDALIGWVDDQGTRALPDLDLPVEAAAARELSDQEVQQTLRMVEEAGGIDKVAPEASPWFTAAVTEAERRGLTVPRQLDLPAAGGDVIEEARIVGAPPPVPGNRRLDPAARAQFDEIIESLYEGKVGVTREELAERARQVPLQDPPSRRRWSGRGPRPRRCWAPRPSRRTVPCLASRGCDRPRSRPPRSPRRPSR
jgi:hypothetical protein